jgi:putative endonuclease
MQEPRTYYVYIMASASRVLCTGATNDLARRVWEHKQKLVPGFTRKYNVTRLVHFEEFDKIEDAIAREKEIKGWLRKKKIALIEKRNGAWRDLSYRFFGAEVLRYAQDDKKGGGVRA